MSWPRVPCNVFQSAGCLWQCCVQRPPSDARHQPVSVYSSESRRSVDVADISVRVIVRGSEYHQNVAPVHDATSAVPGVSFKFSGSYPDVTIFYAVLQSQNDIGKHASVAIDLIEGKADTVEKMDDNRNKNVSHFTRLVKIVLPPLRLLLGLNRSRKRFILLAMSDRPTTTQLKKPFKSMAAFLVVCFDDYFQIHDLQLCSFGPVACGTLT